MRRILHPVSLLSAALLLSGCMVFESKADRAMQRQPNYRAGYDDGCATSSNAGSDMRHGDLVRDDALYDSDKAYHAGWSSGRAACRRGSPAAPENGPLQDMNPGGGH